MSDQNRQIFVGFDKRESANFAVCCTSCNTKSKNPIFTQGLVLQSLQENGLYTRPTTWKDSHHLWDDISEAPMSTEFAISRFLVPALCKYKGWALFLDCDMLWRADPSELFDSADPSKAVMCVKHNHQPSYTTKKAGQIQTVYKRKNWSSFMLFNCEHPSNEKLTVEMVNTLPGRDLHRFCWLEDDEIGELDPAWNYLVGVTELPEGKEPKVVHWTNGSPNLPGFEKVAYADEYFGVLNNWAENGNFDI